MRPKLIIADLPRSLLFLFSTLLLALSTPPCPGKRKAHFVWRKPGTYPPPSTDKFFGNCSCGLLPTETVSARSRPRSSRILVGRSYRYFDCTLYATSWFITTLDKRKSSCSLLYLTYFQSFPFIPWRSRSLIRFLSSSIIFFLSHCCRFNILKVSVSNSSFTSLSIRASVWKLGEWFTWKFAKCFFRTRRICTSFLFLNLYFSSILSCGKSRMLQIYI